MLGFTGYVIASSVGGLLATEWELTIGERLVTLIGPPVAFIATITIATALRGREWIVFFHAATTAIAAVIGLGLAIDGRLARMLDITVLGIGVFLVFGRLGCLHVGCCHGRPARFGVRYGPAHVVVGFWRRWQGRTLFPIQLVESIASAVLVIVGLAMSDAPGAAALTYMIGYSAVRFVLELFRGDPVRPYAYGLSEAQWFCAAAIAAAAAWRPSTWTLIPLGAVLAAGGMLSARRRERELFAPPHVRELDQICDAVLADPAHACRETHLVAVSCHALGDGRLDWVMSSVHTQWSVHAAQRLGAALWGRVEVIPGHTPGVIHLVVAREPSPTSS